MTLLDRFSLQLRKAKREAYEEVMRIAETEMGKTSGQSAGYDAGVVVAAGAIYKRIRALKDSLVEKVEA